MSMVIKDKVKESFSRAASCYDEFTDLQKEIGSELLKQIPEKLYGWILDVGMGTGWFTEQVGFKFPSAKIVGSDFARGMVVQAKKRKINFVIQADAQNLPFKKQSFDLIVSNCAYQWVEDLQKVFCLNFDILHEGGDFCFTCFGKNTLKELRESLSRNIMGSRDVFQNPLFYDSGNLKKLLLDAGFCDVEIEKRDMVICFKDMFDLIRWLKAIGANRVKRDVFMGKDLFDRANCFYKNNFSNDGLIKATFEAIWVLAKK